LAGLAWLAVKVGALLIDVAVASLEELPPAPQPARKNPENNRPASRIALWRIFIIRMLLPHALAIFGSFQILSQPNQRKSANEFAAGNLVFYALQLLLLNAL